MRILLSWFLSFAACFSVVAQVGRLEHSDRIDKLMTRYEVKYGHYDGFMGLSPKFRSEVQSYFYKLDSLGLSPKEEYDRKIILDYFAESKEISDQDTKAWWKHIYENKAYFFDLKKNDFWISVNPIISLKSGLENGDNIILRNTRGIRLNGALGQKIYFSSAIYENQSSFQEYHRRNIERFESIPGNSFYKTFDFNIDNQSYDFLNADGFVGMRLNKFTALELGHGRNFVGHGIRSLLLSDYATNYLYLRANTRVWKFNYQNLFTELAPFTEKLVDQDILLPKKFMAQHLLSFKPNQKWEFSIFETVIFSRNEQFELQYLNPIIFYRTVEHFLNSSDNVILGAQGKWNFRPGNQLYGQVIVDEFSLRALRNDINWFGNKFGIQAGLRSVDVLKVDHLDMQWEINAVRPYTYSHVGSFENYQISRANYSHFSQPLAHPLGANFAEFIWETNYTILNQLTINPRFVYSIQGVDSLGINVGANILLDNNTRKGTANQQFLQGERVSTQLFGLNTSYEFYRNMFLDLHVQYRVSKSVLKEYNLNSSYIGIGIRVNYLEDYRDY